MLWGPNFPKAALRRSAAAGDKSMPQRYTRSGRRFANAGSCKQTSHSSPWSATRLEGEKTLTRFSIPLPSPSVNHGRATFTHGSSPRSKTQGQNSPLRGRSPADWYFDTPKSNLGHVASFPPADQVAWTLNFLDINGDLCVGETEQPLSDLFSVESQRNVALHSLKTGRFSQRQEVGFAESAVLLWSACPGPLLTPRGALL